MKLYLVQHAQALTKEQSPERPLSEQGLADAAKMAAFLLNGGVLVDEVAHSGKVRAEETANILAKAAWFGKASVHLDGIGPNDHTDHLLHGAEAAGGDLMVVGHQPFLGRMVARCLTGREDGVTVGFTPGTIVCLERAQLGWQLNWMMRPELVG
ncbi:phosphohistidine phosphatase SixA [Magnetovibrio blakemorei]|uniref:Phosphohistidine phosphatase SixA n=1 Tax=Magnetovibrio blakemorei TaxID=28181 RepID=A0A1E5QB14_9PROT|nr:phosphohistidine phosphatase SixA [Magnetovibrio blakemorei]OEJ69144.1 phosphohistidine phosphatase SixA [Magnetovibrio blakemorei]